MAGHSKWANIKHKKARQDAKKGKLFTKLAKEISVAAKEGGRDTEMNPRLNQAIQKAKSCNMPNENIERAIKKGTGELEGVSYEETVYEGYGPEGTAILCTALTDNKNRTTGEIRYIFSHKGGNLGESGCVAWMFDKKGLLVIDPKANDSDEEELLLTAIEAGALDVTTTDDAYVEVYTQPEDFSDVKQALEDHGIKFEASEIAMIPQNTIRIKDEDTAEKMMQLIEELEDHEDVQDVYSNYDIPDEIIKDING